MTTRSMKQKLLQKFSSFSLKSAIGMQTNFRTSDINELSSLEIEEMYSRYFPKQNKAAEIIAKQNEDIKLRNLRAIVLKDAQYVGYHDPNDWIFFNKWMLEKSPYKKQLTKYTIEELAVLIKQFKSVRSKYNKEAQVVGSKAWYHKNKLPMPSRN